MKSVIVKFREYLKQASSTEQEVIRYLLENPKEVAEMSIRELSKRTFASPSTITRLCRKAGFEQYKEFQKCLLYENAIRKEAIDELNCEIQKDDSSERLVEKIIYKSIASLEDTKSLVDIEVLEQSVDLLYKAEKIVFFGMGASLLVAKDAYLKFLRVNKTCMVNEEFHTQLVLAKNMTKKDVAVIVSYSGMTKEVMECATILKNAQVPIIAITSFHESPLSRLADYCLYVTATEFNFQTGKLGSRLSQLVVIDMLYVSYVQKDYERCMGSLKNTYIEKKERKDTREGDE